MGWYAAVMGAVGAFALGGAIVASTLLKVPRARLHAGWLRVGAFLVVALPAFAWGRDADLWWYLLPALVGTFVGEALAWAHVARDHPLFSGERYGARVLTLLGRFDGSGRVAADYSAAVRAGTIPS